MWKTVMPQSIPEMDGEEPQDEGEEALDHLPEEDEILSVTVDGED